MTMKIRHKRCSQLKQYLTKDMKMYNYETARHCKKFLTVL